MRFEKIKEEHLELILDWRVRPDVTRYMYTDIEHDMHRQRKWFEHISRDETSRHWIISHDGDYVGVINLSDIDFRNRRCSWGYYIGNAAFKNIGGFVPPYLYNYVFNEMEMNKIVAEVMDGNRHIMKLHEMHGYRFIGAYENHIYKYGAYHDVFVFELHRDVWTEKGKFEKYIAEFEG